MAGSKPGQALPVNQEAAEACWVGQGPVPHSLTHTWVCGAGLAQILRSLAGSHSCLLPSVLFFCVGDKLFLSPNKI